jgi:hypothetical protein
MEDYIAPSLLLLILSGLTIFALPVTRFMDATSEQLTQTRIYVEAVLRQGGRT